MLVAHFRPADSPAAGENEAALIRRAAADPDAFGVLYRKHYRAVASCLYRRTGDVHATEDLAADEQV